MSRAELVTLLLVLLVSMGPLFGALLQRNRESYSAPLDPDTPETRTSPTDFALRDRAMVQLQLGLAITLAACAFAGWKVAGSAAFVGITAVAVARLRRWR